MDKLKEIAKIRQALLIPVDDIIFYDEYVEIISGNNNIGSIPYYSISGIPMYDNNVSVVNLLKWQNVFEQHKKEIEELINELLGKVDYTLTLGTFRNLYVNDNKGQTICTVNCTYQDNTWSISKK